MGIPINVQAGVQSLGRNGTGIIRGGNSGEAITSKFLPDYAQSGFDGLSFSAGNQAAQAVSVALATTYTGLMLYNPIGSGVILVPKFVKFALSVAPAAIATIGLISGVQSAAPTGTTALVASSTQIGNAKSGAGVAYSAATIATPVWRMQLWDGFTAAALPAPHGPCDLRGLFQILPGGFLAIGALTAVTGLGAIAWDEVPANS